MHAETSTGVRNDVGLPRAARAKGDALLLVDCVTSLGGIPVEIDGWGVDLAYSGTQKCLGVPPGLAPFTVGARALGTGSSSEPQSWYLDLNMIAHYVTGEGARAYHHTAPISMIFALHAGLGALLDEGLDAVAGPGTAPAARRCRPACERLGFELFAAEGHRLPELTTVWVPPIGCRPGSTRPACGGCCSTATASRSAAGSARSPARCGASGCMGHTARLAQRRRCCSARSTSVLATSVGLLGHDAPSSVAGSCCGRSCRPTSAPWREVRRRNERLAHQVGAVPHPRPARRGRGADAFAVRCSARQRERQLGTGYGFGIFVDGNFGGEINLSSVQRGPFQSAYVGYWIDEKHAGNGYCPEAVVVLCRFVFEELHLHRVQIAIIPRNAASRRVVEKLDLRDEGVAVRYLEINGGWEDHVRYAITAEEWAERRDELKRLVALSDMRLQPDR